MEINIDETELARLEDLVAHYESEVALDNVSIPHQTIKSVPALVAEVRRLRRNYECSEKSLQRHEHMVADLMETVEAWEWCNQVQHIYDNISFVLGLRQCAINELYTTLTAAREAVHADRE